MKTAITSVDFEELVRQLVELGPAQCAALQNQSMAEVIALIETDFVEAPVCRHCKAPEVHKWGRASGFRRYRCKRCCKTFNALTGSALARLRHRDVWAQFVTALTEGLSVRKAAVRCDIDASTSFRWRRRFLQKPATTGISGSQEGSEPS